MSKPWTEFEVTAIKKYLSESLSNSEICKKLPYRTPDSVKRKIRRLKDVEYQSEAEEQALLGALEQLRLESPVVDDLREYTDFYGVGERQLEICIMDPHFGMHCSKPDSDHTWSMDEAEETVMWAINRLLEQALQYGEIYNRVVFPFGNDFLHADNIYHTTTKGTNQPEMVSWHDAYKRGVALAIRMVERLREVAPVSVYQIPGNHSVHSDYTMGMILDAYFHNDKNVEVDCSSSPYKFHRFGKNLIGYEHGHSVSTIRLAALMANERPQDWAETVYREFHLGDQHRKGSSIPAALEEQGVSVEYHPGLTPPNYWHRVHAFNYQKRGAVAYVWHETMGQEARFNCNLNQYTGKPME